MIDKTPNWKNLNLEKQCGICGHYIQKFKGELQTAHGNCGLSGIYKMRTESCMKFNSIGGQIND